MNSVAVVVLNWNGLDDTTQCLASLNKQSHTNFTIILVDNASTEKDTDERLSGLESLYGEKLHVIRNNKNDGFAGGVNIGIRWAIERDFDYVALFNNDAIADKDWLKNLATEFENKSDVGIVTGLLAHFDGKTIDSTGDYYSTWGIPFPRTRDEKYIKSNTPPSGYVFGATGGASLFSVAMFKEIGLFDETFFAYYEDVDVSFRAQLAGYRIYYTNKAIAYHKQGASSGKIAGFTTYQNFKNLPLLFTKNVPLGLLLPVGGRLFIVYWLTFFNAIRRGGGAYALKGWLMSIYLFFTYAFWQRLSIQRTRKVTTSYIKSVIYPGIPTGNGIYKLRKRIFGR